MSHANSLVICDTEPIAIEGLRGVLDGAGEFLMAAARTSLVEATEAVRDLDPGLLLVDRVFGAHAINDWIRTMHYSGLSTRTVVWGHNLNGVESLRFLQAGAAGVVRKTSPIAELIDCLRTVANGHTWLDRALGENPARAGRNGHSPLTARELQVIELVERGFKNKDIGAALGICTGTVKIHLKHIFEKTGIRGRYGLALNGIKDKGLLAKPVNGSTEVAA